MTKENPSWKPELACVYLLVLPQFFLCFSFPKSTSKSYWNFKHSEFFISISKTNESSCIWVGSIRLWVHKLCCLRNCFWWWPLSAPIDLVEFQTLQMYLYGCGSKESSLQWQSQMIQNFLKGKVSVQLLPEPVRLYQRSIFGNPTHTLLSMSSAHFGVYFPAITDLLRVQKKNSNHKKRKATKVSLEIVASLKSTQKIHCIMSKATMQRCF